VVIISQSVYISEHQVIHLKYIQILNINDILKLFLKIKSFQIPNFHQSQGSGLEDKITKLSSLTALP
jgi:hypothetical protein